MRSHAKAVVAVLAVLLLTLALAANPASAEAPTVSIDPPSDVAYTTAKVSGTVDPKDIGTWWSFEYSSDGGASWSGFNYEGYAEEGTGSQAVPPSGPLELTNLTPGTPYEVRLVANNFTDPEATAVESFETEEVAKPTVALGPVSGITGEDAHFEGEVDSNAPDSNENLSDAAKDAFETTSRFECTPACRGTPEPGTITADDEPQTVSFDPEDLEPSTAYTVKLFASNAGGEEVAEQSFETESLAPTAVTHLVANLRSTSARLSGFVDPQNEPTTYFFELGQEPDLADAQSLPASEDASAGSGGQQVAVGEDLGGLLPEATYYYRVVSDSPTGPPSVGQIRSFTTRPTLPPMGDGVGAWGDRAYELVSRPNKVAPAIPELLSLDGNRAIYTMLGGSDETKSGGLSTQLMAERTSQGWRSFSPMPPRTKALGVPWIMAADPELTLGLASYDPPIPGAGPQTLARFAFDSKELTVGFETPPANSLMQRPSLFASHDLRHLIVTAGQNGQPPLVAGDPAPSLYDVSSSEARVSLLPGDAPPSCGTTTYLETTNSVTTQNQISNDGRRLFFGSRGDDCAGADNLYLREEGPGGSFAAGTGASTTLISGPPVDGPWLDATFVQGTPDGSRAFFVTATRLDAIDTDSTPDLYRHTVGAGTVCLTCAAPGADLSPGETLVSEDGSYAYFTSRSALRPGATSGLANLYRWREQGGNISFIAPIDVLGPAGAIFAVATPSGSVLAFTASTNLLNGLTGTDNAGLSQRYRYDDRDRSVECLTCPATGSATHGHDKPFGSVDRPPVLADDGRIVVFETGEALLDADVNGRVDAYEWRDGRVGLVTGAGNGKAIMEVGALALDGRDILFASQEALVPEAVSGDTQIYDARIGGGFSRVVPPAPCGGDGCQLAPSPAPAGTSAGSATFSGPGNAKPKKTKPKKRKKAKKNHRKAKHKGKKNRAKNDRRTSR